jgi:hypothetical protein
LQTRFAKPPMCVVALLARISACEQPGRCWNLDVIVTSAHG